MLSYARYNDYLRMKVIDETTPNAAEVRKISDYLRRATQYIDRVTRRRFSPHYEVRRFHVPMEFLDLRLHTMSDEDLDVRYDLLQADRVQVTMGTVVDTLEEVPGGGMAISDVTITVTDVDGNDANGNQRISVGDVLEIANEALLVREIDTSTNVVTVKRAVFDTQAATHAATTTINKRNLNTLVGGVDYHLIEYNVQPKWGIRLVWPNLWSGGILTGLTRYSPSIYISGWWGYNEQYEDAWVDTLETVEAGGIVAGDTELTFDDVDGTDDVGITRFETNDLLRIEDELLWVVSTDTDTNKIIVRRGRHGTLATAHSATTPVYRYEVPLTILESCLAIAKTWLDADSSVGGRQGVSDMSTGVELSIPKDIATILELHTRSIM